MTKSTGPSYAPVAVPVRSADPLWEPVDLAAAKRRCDVAEAVTLHDKEIGELITEARELVETDISTIAAVGSFLWTLAEFPKELLRFPLRNVSAVDQIKYDDEAGDEQTLADFQFLSGTAWPVLYPTADSAFPTTEAGNRGAVRITFTAGFADATQVPERFKQAVLARVRWLFVREDLTEGARRAYDSIIKQELGAYP